MKNFLKYLSIHIFSCLILPIFIFIIDLSLSNCECQVDSPILKNNSCQLFYCSKEDFENEICIIDNEIIKTQWLNNLLLFNEKNYRYCSFALNSQGDLIAELSTEEANGVRLFYGLKKDGTSFFKNSYTYTKIITNKDDNEHPIRYESENIFISLNNTKEYLISTSIFLGNTELFDFEENIESFITTCNFTGYNIYSTKNQIIELNNRKEYLHIFIGREKTNEEYNNFFLVLNKYSFYSNVINDDEGYSIIQQETKENVFSSRAISGYKTDSNLIIIFYYNFNFNIAIYDKDLNPLKEITISTGGSINGDTGAFLKCIYLKNNLGVFIFFKSETDVAPYINIEEINEVENDYSINEKFNIFLNLDGYRFITEPILSDLTKINDNRFCLISSSYDKEKLYILLFDLYNSDENLKLRFYNIYLLELYNYRIYREIASIIYNNNLVISLSACDSLPCNYDTSSNTTYFSFLLFFNYINSSDLFIDFSPFVIENKEENENEANFILTLLEGIKIDNNIFGYELLEQIKLLSFPNELTFYNLGEYGEVSQINENGILTFNHKIEQKKSISKNSDDIYFIEYQFIIKEPSYEKFNQFPVIIIDYPENTNETQKGEYIENIFYSRVNKVKFKLCNEFCKTCEYLGTQENHKCLGCLENYEKDDLGNCFKPKENIEEENDDTFKEEEKDENNKEEETDYFEEEEFNKNVETEEIDTSVIQSKTIDYLCWKYYIDKNTKEKICINDEDNCPLRYPFLNETNNECMESISFQNLLEFNFTKYNSTEENEIIYNLFITSIIAEYSGNDNLIITTQDSNVFQLTNSLNELNTKNGINSNNNNLSMIDLGDCGKELKSLYQIEDDTPLIIFKLEKLGEVASKRNVQYEIYNPMTKKRMNLSICDDEKINLYLPVDLNEETKELHEDLLNYGYDLFNPEDSFYQDICAPYTSVNGADVLLSDRRNYYFNDTETSCQDGCTYSEYNIETSQLKCECSVNSQKIETKDIEKKFNNKFLFTSFYDVIKYSNYKVLKCHQLVFDLKKMKYNYGSYFFIFYFFFYTLFNIIFLIRGFFNIKVFTAKILYNFTPHKPNNSIKLNNKTSIFTPKRKVIINTPPRKSSIILNENSRNASQNSLNINSKDFNLVKKKKLKGRNSLFNNSKSKSASLESSNKLYIKKHKRRKKKYNIKLSQKNQINIYTFVSNENANMKIESNNIFSYFKGNNFSDFELNELEYLEAIIYDKRTFIRYYWSLIRREHLIFFTFFSYNDYNILSIKLSKFIFAVATDFALNVIFFFDETMSKIYLDYGKYNFIAQIPQAIYSTVLSEALDVLLRYLCLTEKDMYKIKKIEKQKYKFMNNDIFNILRCVKIKLFVYFTVTHILFFFFWYFVAAFCAVYKNTQIILFKDSFLSLFLSLLYPFGLYLLPTALRIISLRDSQKRLKCLYKLSDIIPLI